MEWQDEVHAIFAVYAATRRTPEPPDVALMPGRGGSPGPASWQDRLTPAEARRMRAAIDQGARNGPCAAPLHDD